MVVYFYFYVSQSRLIFIEYLVIKLNWIQLSDYNTIQSSVLTRWLNQPQIHVHVATSLLFTPNDVYDNQFVKTFDVNKHDEINRAMFDSHS